MREGGQAAYLFAKILRGYNWEFCLVEGMAKRFGGSDAFVYDSGQKNPTTFTSTL